MGKRLLGYMLTWTTYGTWLQGDLRGYVKDGRTFGENVGLRAANEAALVARPVKLSRHQKEVVRGRLLEQATRIGQEVSAIAVFSNHVHIVGGVVSRSIPRVVQMYKRAATNRLRDFGIGGKVWTRGYYVRYCYDEAALKQMVKYVLRHED